MEKVENIICIKNIKMCIRDRSIASQMYNNNADIIFACAGDSGVGVLECAKETGKFAIGVDRDQNDIAPENILTSAMKKVNEGVFNVVKDLSEGNFDGGKTLVFGLKAVSYTHLDVYKRQEYEYIYLK